MIARKKQVRYRRLTLMDRFRRARARYYRSMRYWFSSPAEARFVEIMGGIVVRLPWIRSPYTGFPLTYVWLGFRLLRHRYRREVRCGRYYVDFCNDKGRGIEIDGKQWHTDKRADAERDRHIRSQGYRVYRIPAYRILKEPAQVRRDVLKYISE